MSNSSTWYMLYLNEAMTSFGREAGAPSLQPPSCCYGRGARSWNPPPDPAHSMAEPRTGQKTTQELHQGHHWQLWEMNCSKHAPVKSRQCPGCHEQGCWEDSLCLNLSITCLAYYKLFWSLHLRKGMKQPRRDSKDLDCPIWRQDWGDEWCLHDKILWNNEDMKIGWMQSCYSPNPAIPELRCTR